MINKLINQNNHSKNNNQENNLKINWINKNLLNFKILKMNFNNLKKRIQNLNIHKNNLNPNNYLEEILKYLNCFNNRERILNNNQFYKIENNLHQSQYLLFKKVTLVMEVNSNWMIII